jgi:uncharacterized protein YbaP (TraB family)
MWEIKGEHNTVYLLGSIHLLRQMDHPLPTVIESAYQDAETLIMEIDMDDLDPMAAQVAFTEHGVLHDETTLRDLMGDELYQQASEAAAAINIPLELLAKTEPWYAAVTTEIMVLSRIGFNPNLGIETYMTAKAVGDNKPIEGFETIEEQLAFLDGLPLAAQRDMLLSTLLEGAEIKEMMDGMIDAWRHGDLDYLNDVLLDSFAKFEAINKALITDRNERWVIQTMELLDDDDDYLIVVGAMHLVGKGGVPERLAREGIRIRQLSEPPTLR